MQRLWRQAAALVSTIGVLTIGTGLGSAGAALAQVPRPWEMGFQTAHSPVQQRIESLHSLVLWIITLITLLVGALLVWVMIRYNARRNPVPSRTAHHTLLEVAWTVVPVLILALMIIPSFRLVFYEDRTQHADMTVKVTGHQWCWEYAIQTMATSISPATSSRTAI